MDTGAMIMDFHQAWSLEIKGWLGLLFRTVDTSNGRLGYVHLGSSLRIFSGAEKRLRTVTKGTKGMILGTSKLSKNSIKSLSLWMGPSQGKRALFVGQDCVFLEILTKRA